MPPSHASYQEWGPERIREWAGSIGPNTLNMVLAIERSKSHIIQAQRACLGLLGEQKRYGSHRLENACTIALARQMPYVPFVKKLLKQGADQVLQEGLKTTKTASVTHINIRGADYYQ